MMATPGQVRYIEALMSERGLVDKWGRIDYAVGRVPHLERPRRGHPDLAGWVGRLTVRQASEVIEALLAMDGEGES